MHELCHPECVTIRLQRGIQVIPDEFRGPDSRVTDFACAKILSRTQTTMGPPFNKEEHFDCLQFGWKRAGKPDEFKRSPKHPLGQTVSDRLLF